MTPTAGIHELTEVEYHADLGALSSSGAKLLLPPSTPATFHWLAQHPEDRRQSDAMDLGTAAHRAVLGAGRTVTYVQADDWRTKAAREQRDLARASGGVALLDKHRPKVDAMAAALRGQPLAAGLLNRPGQPERSLYAEDPDTGVMLRARLDYLPDVVPGKRLLITEYKTAESADPTVFGRACVNYGYHLQAAWYRRMAILLELDPDPAVLFIVQETTPPYLVTVLEMPYQALVIGDRLNRQAIDTFAFCRRTDHWPGHSDIAVAIAEFPAWYFIQHEAEQFA
jgi:hypothetical protein